MRIPVVVAIIVGLGLTACGGGGESRSYPTAWEQEFYDRGQRAVAPTDTACDEISAMTSEGLRDGTLDAWSTEGVLRNAPAWLVELGYEPENTDHLRRLAGAAADALQDLCT